VRSCWTPEAIFRPDEYPENLPDRLTNADINIAFCEACNLQLPGEDLEELKHALQIDPSYSDAMFNPRNCTARLAE